MSLSVFSAPFSWCSPGSLQCECSPGSLQCECSPTSHLSCLHFFSFFFSVQLQRFLSLFHILICFSASFNLLLISSSVFFISIIAFHLWFFFICSKSLLNSLYSSSFLQSFSIIFWLLPWTLYQVDCLWDFCLLSFFGTCPLHLILPNSCFWVVYLGGVGLDCTGSLPFLSVSLRFLLCNFNCGKYFLLVTKLFSLIVPLINSLFLVCLLGEVLRVFPLYHLCHLSNYRAFL